LFEQQSFDFLAFKHKGNKNGFARTMLIGREPGKAIAAIDEFFNSELQVRILCSKPKPPANRIAESPSHIEQTQSRQSIFLQQSFMHVLLEQLLNLRGGHFAPVRRELPISLRPNRDDLLIRSRRQ